MNKVDQSYGTYEPIIGIDVKPRETYERFEDMSPDGRLQVFIEDDGDVIVTAVPPPSNSANPMNWLKPVSVQFCAGSGGGQSPRVRLAILELARAIEIENRERQQHRV